MILLTLAAALIAALLYALAATAALRQLAGHAPPGRLVLPLAACAMLGHLLYLALALPAAHGADFSVLKTATTAALLIVLLLSGLHWRRALLPLLPPTYLFTTLLLVMTALLTNTAFTSSATSRPWWCISACRWRLTPCLWCVPCSLCW